MLIYQAIQKIAKQQGSATAICNNKVEISYFELIHQVDKTINYLLSKGVKRGERIALLAVNSPEVIYYYLAASRLGNTIIFLYDLYDATEVEFQKVINHANPNWIFLDKSHISKKRSLFFQKPNILSLENVENDFLKIKIPQFNEANSNFIQCYTSGTTGDPKGVCLSETSMFHQAQSISQKMGLTFTSRVLLTGYLFNTTGLPIVTAILRQGGALYFPSYQDVKDIFSEVESKRITHFMLQPFGIDRALLDEQLPRRDLKCLKLIAYGAAPMPQTLLRKARRILKCAWLQGYGLTETCGPVTWLDDYDHSYKPGSVGKIEKGLELKIVDEKNRENKPYEIGEIMIKGVTVMSGYWHHERRRPDMNSLSCGWLRTGDLGYLDEEGYLYLSGRKKDCIVTADGFTLYPKEVEDVIYSFDRIEDVAVFGWFNSEDDNEYAVAVIQSRDELNISEFRKYLLGKLSSLKLPQYIVTTTSPLPRNRNGKLIKRILQGYVTTLSHEKQLTEFQ